MTPQSGCRARQPNGGGSGDRISGLHDDLLKKILAGVCCARTTARAGLASRRWRGLWAQLPEIHLKGVAPGSIEAALDRLEAARKEARTTAALDVLHVETCRDGVSSRLIVSCLRRAVRLASAELRVSLTGVAVRRCSGDQRPVQLPCFERTASIEIELREPFCLVAPRAGEFRKLERLVLKACHFDAAALLCRCPGLRVLQLGPSLRLPSRRDPAHIIHSPSLEELVVVEYVGISQIDIAAPKLKHLSLSADIASLSVSAPNLEKLSLNGRLDIHPLSGMGKLRELMLSGLCIMGFEQLLLLGIGHGVESFMKQLPRLHVLQINIVLWKPCEYAVLQKLPKTSILMLHMRTCGREFGGTVLRLLKMVEGVEELALLIDSRETREICLPGCRCHHPRAWISGLSLPFLKKVEFKGFTGAHSVVNVLELLFTSAQALEQMTVTPCNKDSTVYEGGKQQLLHIFSLYPAVECQLLEP